MPRKNRIALMALLTAAALVTVEAQAEIYKSIDKDGHVTYSNAPAPGAITMTGIDILPAPSKEDVLAAQEEYQRIAALGTEMEKRRLQLEELRARLNMQERMYEAYLQQSQAQQPQVPVLAYDVPWAFPADFFLRPTHFNRFPRVHDGRRHRRSGGISISIGKHSPMQMGPRN